MPGTVWDKFFWSDWETDQALKLCGLAAQGLWMRMLCICANADPKGYLLVAGQPLTPADLASLVGKPEREVETLLSELASKGVFSTDRKGRIYNRRMVRAVLKARTARQNGKLGGNPSLEKDSGIPPLDNPQDKGGDKPHKPEARKKGSEPNGSAPPSEWADDRANLFGGALQWLVKHTGKPEKNCRSVIARWLKINGDDAAAVLEVIRAARDKNVAEPIAWIEAALRPAPNGELKADWPARGRYFARSGWRDEWGRMEDIPPEFKPLFNPQRASA